MARLAMSRKPTDTGKHWSAKDKLKVIAAFSVLGNASKVEEVTGVPANTINYWKTLPWWFEEMDKLRKAEDEAAISGYGRIMQKTINQLEKRIEEGDIVILKDGTKTVKPISGKELAYISTNVTNSRLKIQGQALDNAVKSITLQDRLQQLRDQFTSFVKKKDVIDVEVIPEEDTNAKQDKEASQNDGSGCTQSEICEESRDSNESCEGIQQSGHDEKVEKGEMLNGSETRL